MAAGEYELYNILDSRLGHSSPDYLVKWLRYPVFESTWEPASHLANELTIFRQFCLTECSAFSMGGVILDFIQIDLKVCFLNILFLVKI